MTDEVDRSLSTVGEFEFEPLAGDHRAGRANNPACSVAHQRKTARQRRGRAERAAQLF